MSDTFINSGSGYLLYNFHPYATYSGSILMNPIFNSYMEHSIMDFDLGCAEVDIPSSDAIIRNEK